MPESTYRRRNKTSRFPDKYPAAFEAGTLDRVAAICDIENTTQADFIRRAVHIELKHAERKLDLEQTTRHRRA